MPLYAWSPTRRANRACIRHHIEKAMLRKAWVATIDANWCKHASDVSKQMALDYDTKSVKQLARESLEYHRHRAWLGLASGSWPWDRPAFNLWAELTGVTPNQQTAIA